MTDADKKRIGPHLTRLAHFCSMQERAVSEVLQKLRKTPLPEEERSYIIERLKTEGFLDEFRYARAFANDKFNLNGWGRIKISYALKLKQVSSGAIEQAVDQIDPDRYTQLITDLVAKKLRELPEEAPEQGKKNKVARFLLQRGFEPDLVWQAIREVC